MLNRLVRCTGIAFVGLVFVAGCKSNEARYHRSYEYRGESPRPQEREREMKELESDYEMVSPGEMVVEPE